MNRILNDFLPDASAPESTMVVLGIQFLSAFNLITEEDISGLLKPREVFSHKGTYGHALIIAGSTETMGAALLAAKGCLYAGAGLTTAAIPFSGLTALNTSLPEVMYVDKVTLKKTKAFERYNAVAIGPGLSAGGLSAENLDIMESLYQLKQPVIADADMLTFLSSNKSVFSAIAKGSILTPHVKEFDKLFGEHSNWWERLQTAVSQAKKHQMVIVLKNQYTFVVDQSGCMYINPTGGPAMAQGGMGDVLTGIISAFVAQGYSSRDAALLSCYIHGRSGDKLAEEYANITASQVAKQVPKTIKSLLK
jgi:NAD(P)H-hydrate epimerase